ncbi:MAG: exodeoxyribonuclease VII large subunit [Streptosporangiaceae bacterium]
MALQTSAESPAPVRTVLQLVAGWIGRLGRVWVEGQVTEIHRRAATTFLTLRDPVADVSVRVVCPRTVYDAAPPLTDGARVVVWARPDFHLARGSFALMAFEIRPLGLGALLARLERLRQILATEGLFAAGRKRRLPFLPHTVGLVCGQGSAAERDVCDNARRRWPAVRFRVEEVAVQGAYAATEVTDAVRRLDADPEVEVVVVARGGGSLEDLLPFSDEGLVRAVASCGTPLVSAIGHEQDCPLLDLVADVRASTPTDAGRRIVPQVEEELVKVRGLRDRCGRHVTARLDREAAVLRALRTRPVLAAPTRELDLREERVADLRGRARRRLTLRLDQAGEDLRHARARLVALSPAATLRRGYTLVQRDDGTVVHTATEVAVGDALFVRFADGRLEVEAKGAE